METHFYTPYLENLRKLPWKFIALFSFIVLTYVNLLTHEPWLDEAQSWLIARDVPLKELFGVLRYEGHPPLYYLILMPLAKTGMNFFLILTLSWLFIVGAAALILYKTKFPFYVKVLFIFSAGFSLYAGTFARSYGLLLLLVSGVLALYQKRLSRPKSYALLICLLAGTHAFGLVFAAFFGAVFLYDLIRVKSKDIPWVILIAAPFILASAFPILFSHSDTLLCAPGSHVNGSKLLQPLFIERLFFGLTTSKSVFALYYNPNLGSALYSLFIAGMLLFALWPSKRALIIGGGSYLVLAFYLNFINLTSWDRQYFYIVLSFLIGFSIAFDETDGYKRAREVYKKAAYTMLFVLMGTLLFFERAVMHYPVFSSSSANERIVRIIVNKSLEKETFVLYPTEYALQIAPHLPEAKFFHLEAGEKASYIRWSKAFCHDNNPKRHKIDKKLFELMLRHFPDDTAYLIIYTPVVSISKEYQRYFFPMNSIMQRVDISGFTLFLWMPPEN